MGVVAYLYEADGEDRQIPLAEVTALKLGRDSLLWIDVDQRDEAELADVMAAVGLTIDTLTPVNGDERPALYNYGNYFHFRINAAPHQNGHDEEDKAAPASSRRAEIVPQRGRHR